ncbi:MAG: PD40 domain-containing protein [Chloroflexi bacterium]|nr:PD40 domain-containing protein [Chloroflexota bacterium]
MSRRPALTSRLSRRALLLGIGGAALAGCTLDQPAPGAEPSPASDPPVSDTPAPAPSAVSPPPPAATTTTAPLPTVAPSPTPEPHRDGVAGRLLYTRRGNLHQLSGTASRQLTSTGDLAWPRWSPDGGRIVVIRRGDAYSDLVLLNPDGQGPAPLTRHQSKAPGGSKEYALTSVWATWPAWEPDGTRLIYTADVTASHMTLWQIDAKGGQPRQVPGVADLGANIEAPAYAPDGKSLAFCLSYDTPTQLWLLNLVAGTRAALTDGKQTVYDPAWTPDGKALVAAVVDGARSRLHVFAPDGKDRGPLISRLSSRAATWSPDGKALAFIGEEGGRFNIYVAEISGNADSELRAGEPRRLTADGDIDGPSGLSWTR